MIDLARIKQLAEAARTRDVMACSDCDGSGEAQDGSACESCDGECWFSIKLKLAADVPALVAECERLRAENERLVAIAAICNEYHNGGPVEESENERRIRACDALDAITSQLEDPF